MMLDDRDDTTAKLCDFGLSLILGPGEKVNESMGTLEYCAPEIIYQRPYSFEIDIWALGVILYRMICGDLIFEYDDKDKVAFSIAKREISYHHRQWSKASAEVMDLLKKMLVKEPSKRISIEEVMRHPWLL